MTRTPGGAIPAGAKWLIACCLAAGALVGCGPGKASLSGSVSFNGKKVKFGTVTVFGSDGIPKYGPIDRDGNFVVNEVAAGNVKVAVASPEPKTALPADVGDKGRPKSTNAPDKVDPIDVQNWFEIPEKYQYVDKSGLTFTLSRGANTFNIDLK